MTLIITKQAAQFYIEEMLLEKGEALTLFVRIGGVGSGGFSVGVFRGRPDIDFFEITVSSIIFCVTNEDQWYFDEMTIHYDIDTDQLLFDNPKIEDVTNPNP